MIELDNIPQTSMDLIRLILVDQLELDKERVNIYDEKWKIPPDDELFIVVEYRGGKCIANRNIFVSTGGDPVEQQEINMLERITVGIFSRNRSSTQRKEEVLMAVLSSFAQGLQEKYSFKIARIGPIDDLSALEATAMLKRYDIELSVYAWYSKTITPGYINAFTIKVIADVGGAEMIENITQELTDPTS